METKPTESTVILDDEDIAEFQKLWREEFKEEISAHDARQRGTELIDLFYLLAKHKPTGVGTKQELRKENLDSVSSPLSMPARE